MEVKHRSEPVTNKRKNQNHRPRRYFQKKLLPKSQIISCFKIPMKH